MRAGLEKWLRSRKQPVRGLACHVRSQPQKWAISVLGLGKKEMEGITLGRLFCLDFRRAQLISPEDEWEEPREIVPPPDKGESKGGLTAQAVICHPPGCLQKENQTLLPLNKLGNQGTSRKKEWSYPNQGRTAPRSNSAGLAFWLMLPWIIFEAEDFIHMCRVSTVRIGTTTPNFCCHRERSDFF